VILGFKAILALVVVPRAIQVYKVTLAPKGIRDLGYRATPDLVAQPEIQVPLVIRGHRVIRVRVLREILVPLEDKGTLGHREIPAQVRKGIRARVVLLETLELRGTRASRVTLEQPVLLAIRALKAIQVLQVLKEIQAPRVTPGL
jgi:hypothetical protein